MNRVIKDTRNAKYTVEAYAHGSAPVRGLQRLDMRKGMCAADDPIWACTQLRPMARLRSASAGQVDHT